ncbi:hypothetical protein PLICRDRAFT_670308, partial [Plicaturopsis crispa FD-325 SS-3]
RPFFESLRNCSRRAVQPSYRVGNAHDRLGEASCPLWCRAHSLRLRGTDFRSVLNVRRRPPYWSSVLRAFKLLSYSVVGVRALFEVVRCVHRGAPTALSFFSALLRRFGFSKLKEVPGVWWGRLAHRRPPLFSGGRTSALREACRNGGGNPSIFSIFLMGLAVWGIAL